MKQNIFTTLLALWKTITFLNLTKLTLFILVIELILGGGGRYLVFPYDISFRMTLLGLSFILWFVCLLRKEVSFTKVRKEIIFFSLFMGVIVPVIGSIVGFVEGNKIVDIISDANGYIFYFFIIIFASVFHTKKDLQRLFYVFLGSIMTWGISSLATFMLNSVHLIDVRHIGYILKTLGYGGIMGIMPNRVYRFFTEGSLFLQVGLAFVWGVYLFNNKFTFKNTIVFTMVSLLFLFVITLTYTRGFWLAVILEIIVFMVLTSWRSKLLFSGILVFLFFSSALISHYVFQFSLVDYYKNRLLSSIPANLELTETENTLDQNVKPEASSVNNQSESQNINPAKPATDAKKVAQTTTKGDETRSDEVKKADPYSAQYRVEMYKILIQKIKARPILGYGFGKNFEELEGAYSYELSYLDMITKFGLPAFSIWLIGLSYFLFLVFFRWLKDRKDQLNFLMLSFAIGIGSILLTGFFNPFLVSSTGILSLVLFFCYCNFQSLEQDRKNFKIF